MSDSNDDTTPGQPKATPARPDYRLKSIAEQIGGHEVQVAPDLNLLVPEKEFHLATPELKPDEDTTCACHSVCTCVPVTTCACHAVCRCDAVAGVVRPAPAPSSPPSGGGGTSHYWRPN